jgi:hypothetical protein
MQQVTHLLLQQRAVRCPNRWLEARSSQNQETLITHNFASTSAPVSSFSASRQGWCFAGRCYSGVLWKTHYCCQRKCYATNCSWWCYWKTFVRSLIKALIFGIVQQRFHQISSRMKSIMAISMDSGILLFSDSNLNNVDNKDSLDIIQLSSSLFALYKISCSSSSLKWLLKVCYELQATYNETAT